MSNVARDASRGRGHVPLRKRESWGRRHGRCRVPRLTLLVQVRVPKRNLHAPRSRPRGMAVCEPRGGSLWGGCLRRSGSGIAPRHHGVGHAGNRRRAEVVGRIKYTVRSRRHLLTPCPKEGRGCNSALGSLLPGVRERYRGGGSAPRQHSTPSSPLLD